jgi:hypothetical protein
MMMMNEQIEYLLANKPNKEKVKQHFFSHFLLVKHIGPLPAMALLNWEEAFEDFDLVVAFYLLGAAWGLQKYESDTGPTPDMGFKPYDAESTWEWLVKYAGEW